MRFVDILFAFPGLILAIVIAGLLGPSSRNAMIAIGVIYAPAFARVIRGSVLTVESELYMESGRVAGATNSRLIAKHVLPNIVAPLIVLTTVYLSSAILAEAGTLIPGTRHAATGTVLGRHAQFGAIIHGAMPLDGDRSGIGDHVRRARAQFPRGWAARHS